MSRKYYLTLALAITLLMLTVAPVYAAPSLSLGSTASYSLTGKVQANESCTTNPVSYASQACLGIVPVTITTAFVTITGDNHSCAYGPGINDPFAALRCRFDPSSVTVIQGSTIVWTNIGNVTHTVTANQTADDGLPGFDSGPIAPYGGRFSHTFNQTGTYHYYDSNYGQLLLTMRGVVTVTAPPPPPPSPEPKSIQVDLTGSLGWNVEGLSASEAVLLVSNTVGFSVSPFPLVSFTPLTESGSFEQSINLSTRVASPGTAASVVRSVLASFLQALPGPSLTTDPYGPVFRSMLAGRSSDPYYTEWWVNGPLSIGSPVQILNGWSTVTGSESLDLGGIIGSRDGWIVTSKLSQTFNVNIPNSNSPFNPFTSTASANLKLLWTFDKTADILLRANDTLTITMHSVRPTTVTFPYTATCVPQVGTTCISSCPPVWNVTSCPILNSYPPPIISVYTTIPVIRDTSVTISLVFRLSSTSLSLTASGSGSHTSTLMDLFASIPWTPYGIAGLAAGAAVALIIGFSRRTKGTHLPGLTPNPTPTTSSPSTPT